MPTPAIVPSSSTLMPFSWGPNFFTNAVRSLEAGSQVSYRRWPTNGTLATDSGGGGMWYSSFLIALIACSADSANDMPRK